MTSIKRLAKIRTWVQVGRNDANNFGVTDQEGTRPVLGLAGDAYHNGYLKTLAKRTSTMPKAEVDKLVAKNRLFEAKKEVLRHHVIDQDAIALIDKAIATA